MATIPQRELRNNVSEILRRAERGERITVTVSGRPVAELGPVTGAGRSLTWDRFAEIVRETPVNESWREDLERMRREDEEAAREQLER